MSNSIMELVAPAGDYESFLAAVKGGADAVYLGLKGYGARRRAQNFNKQEILEAIDYAHLRGVKVYITLNTILKDIEIETLYDNIFDIYKAGADAFIVQDIGLFYYIKQNFPEIDIHGSTQMTVANHRDADFLYNEGITRLVLARELSKEEIFSIKKKTNAALEIFVSGALCVSYSGKCYLSSMIGGRSGNRGMCAQPCRRLYTKSDEDNSKYYFSPKDQLLEIEEIEALKDKGIDAIKIEGRMKNPLYIYETVKYYRALLDNNLDKQEQNSFRLFNRGYAKGYFYGKSDELINQKYSSHFGYKLGNILSDHHISLDADIMLGDGISFVDKDKDIIEGNYVNYIEKDNKSVRNAIKGDKIRLKNIPESAVEVYKTYDKDINDFVSKELQQKKRKKAIKGEISIKTGEKLILKLYTEKVSVELSSITVEKAMKRPLATDDIAKKISELGETPFFLESLDIDYDGTGFVAHKVLKELKREAAKMLESKLKAYYKRSENPEKYFMPSINRSEREPEIVAYVKNKIQYDAVKKAGINKVYTKNEFLITESRLEKAKASSLVSNYYFLEETSDKLSLDWDMNIINSYSLEYLQKYENIDTVYLSPEISFEEIANIKNNKMRLGLVVYGKLKLMYIEKDIFDEKEIVVENDNEDILKVIKNKFENTEIYTNEVLNILSEIKRLGMYGIDEVRLDFVDESPEEIMKIIANIKVEAEKYYPYNYEKGVF